MSQANKDQDQSMEEILQSIKRIIAEEGTPTNTGSDVLELTDMLGDDEDTTPASDIPLESEAPTIGTMSIDEIMAAPLSTGAQEPEAKPAPAAPAAPIDPFDALGDIPVDPAFAPTPAPEPPPVPAPAPKAAPAPAPAAALPQDAIDNLLSDTAFSAASSALEALKAPAPVSAPAPVESASFRSGTTVEDLVVESLKPMLKAWLDANLPGIVEKLVEKEVRRLSNR
jgi:cell pole-organizing protein PopZ